MRMMVQATISAPSDLAHQFSKQMMRRSDVYFMGVNWETADHLCAVHGLVIDGFGNYVTRLEAKVAELEALLAEKDGRERDKGCTG